MTTATTKACPSYGQTGLDRESEELTDDGMKFSHLNFGWEKYEMK